MYPSGWPDEVHYEGSVYTYSADIPAALSALAFSQKAADQDGWLSVVAYPMDDAGRDQIVKDLYSKDHPLSALGLWVLAERISQDALGMELFVAARLAGMVLSLWMPFHAWAAKQGLVVANLSIHDLLSAAYGWQASCCEEQKDLDKLNRSIFGSKNPWGR